MRRFIITSPGFTGQAELIYKENGTLSNVDLGQAEMSVDVIDAFKKKVPIEVSEIETAFANTRATILEAGIEVSFAMFYNSYGQRHSKKRAEGLWNKLSKVDQAAAYFGVRPYLRYLNRDTWRSQADPDTYLRNRYWESEWR